MGAITPAHLILILVVALIVIGPGKLPETGAALGKAIRQFKDAADGVTGDGSALAQPATQPQQPAVPYAAQATAYVAQPAVQYSPQPADRPVEPAAGQPAASYAQPAGPYVAPSVPTAAPLPSSSAALAAEVSADAFTADAPSEAQTDS
jgi:TatA/E family protein of Tat protein translocase